ncbi:hypothetical protein Smp_043600.1 [Schistosoma mansoni]|uniref:hypothetical protein n=1 Tax=Schistosoma mansoni TaxID=6183 RepID=UPI00022DBE92|nr:hypothetical protein Smp_043600.1 [Schistosoma mansoni]|eukprot:XP_018652709.1 hypothetical protein Smp_043600.1 [Schistosoma mansoni]
METNNRSYIELNPVSSSILRWIFNLVSSNCGSVCWHLPGVVEYLIRIHSFYPYPVLAVFSDVGRFGFYSVTIMATVLCFGVSVLMVRSLNKTQYKRLSSKTQQRTERKESVPVQSKHKKSKKTD